jgi:cellulose synthase/poly-beta-1,6-N-acetylglucosamine synthase-like glycosyltransferase
MPQLAAFAVAIGLIAALVLSGGVNVAPGERDAGWWALTTISHLPLLLILLFVAGGLVERIGFFWKGRAPQAPGRLPATYPSVTVQLPMFNEHAVAQRVIEAAAAMDWPRDRFTVQVLDDSTDADTLALVERVCADATARTGVRCTVIHRVDRRGYKAGALEVGRRQTDAEFLVIFDADFLPPRDFLLTTVPHFYLADGTPDEGLALVQAQWGHLNHDESALTRAQSLWVDDHHTLQMSWRSAAAQFVNFTGTAGVWRASAIEAAGGWRADSLVEDCELSFRHLFAGYRTKFVKEIVAPAELPATYTAYKAQQKRWTQGWVQVQRLHLRRLLFGYRSSLLRRLQLLHHMTISWQWPAWALWITILPFLIATDHWFGALGAGVGVLVYVIPSAIWIAVSVTAASVETKHTYSEPISPVSVLRRLQRVVPYLAITTGMLPHQVSAFAEGLFGPMNSEFERTPKSASVTSEGEGLAHHSALAPRKPYRVKVHWPYVLTEAGFVVYQLAWVVLFAASGLVWNALAAVILAGCVLALAVQYGDHAGRVLFVVDRSRVPFLGQKRIGSAAAG